MNSFNNYKDSLRLLIVTHFQKIIDDEIICRRIEKSIYNYVITLANKEFINKNWENIIFRNLYI